MKKNTGEKPKYQTCMKKTRKLLKKGLKNYESKEKDAQGSK